MKFTEADGQLKLWEIKGTKRHGPFTLRVRAMNYTEAKRVVCRSKDITLDIESIRLIEA